MVCPHCACIESDVIYTLQIKSRLATIRRRECLKCKKRYTTLETIKSEILHDKKYIKFISKSS